MIFFFFFFTRKYITSNLMLIFIMIQNLKQFLSFHIRYRESFSYFDRIVIQIHVSVT